MFQWGFKRNAFGAVNYYRYGRCYNFAVLQLRRTSVEVAPSTRGTDNLVTEPPDGLLAVQWYQPALDRLISDFRLGVTDRHVVMLYSYVEKANKRHTGARWISITRLRQLHCKYVWRKLDAIKHPYRPTLLHY